MKIKKQKCKCGCGQLTSGEYNYELKRYPLFVNYHQGTLCKVSHKGKHFSLKTEFKSGKLHPYYGKVGRTKNKTYEELYDFKTSQRIKKSISLAHKNKFKVKLLKKVLKKEYITKKHSSVTIAKKHGMSIPSVLDRLKFYGIKIRNRSEMQCGKLNYAYGKSPWNKDLTNETDKRVKQMSISMLGKNKGKHPKCEFKKGNDNGRKGKKIEEIFGKEKAQKMRKKMRESKLNYISEKYNNGEPIHPCVGRQEKPILDELEKQHNCKFIRQHCVDGYWLDGYCPELNISVEIDEPYHNNLKVKKHDKDKQKYIIKKLKCEFIRIPVKK